MMDFEQRLPNELIASAVDDPTSIKSCAAFAAVVGNRMQQQQQQQQQQQHQDRMDTDSCISSSSCSRCSDVTPPPSSEDERSLNAARSINEVAADAAAAVYLRNAYVQLHENRYRKMNRLLTSIDQQQQQQLQQDQNHHCGSHDLHDDCDISVLAKNVANFGFSNGSNDGNHRKTKPIITFTPVHSIDERSLSDFQSPSSSSPPPSSPVSERASSSGSSSPLLEVPVANFQDMALEMMRPPLNTN